MRGATLDRLLTGALLLGFFGLYLFTRSARPDPDALAFGRLALMGPGTPGFFQAEHLLYPFWGWVAYQGTKLFGYAGPPDGPMAALNGLAGAAAVAATYRLGRLIRPDGVGVGLGAALLTGLSYAHWLHSTQAEDQMVANALVLGAIAAGLGGAPGLAAGGAAALGVLSHGTAVLPAAVFGLWLLASRRGRAVAPEYWLGLLGVTGVGLLLGAVLGAGVRTPAGMAAWLTDRPAAGIWGRLAPADVPLGLKTAAGALFWPAGQASFKDLLSEPLNPAGWLEVFAFLCLLRLAGLGLGAWWVGLKYRHPAAPLLVAWALGVGLFALGWAPEDPQFWTLAVPPVAVSIAHVLLPEGRSRSGGPAWGAALAGLVVAVGAANYLLVFGPAANPANNPDLARAQCLADLLGPKDLVITLGWDWADGYLPRLGHEKVVGILDLYLRAASRDPGRLRGLLAQEVRSTWDRGGRVYLVRWPELSAGERAWLVRTGSPTPETLGFAARPRTRCGDETVFEIVGL